MRTTSSRSGRASGSSDTRTGLTRGPISGTLASMALKPPEDEADDLPPAEAARARRRDHDAAAAGRSGMRTGLAKQFKQVLDTQVRRAAGAEPKAAEPKGGEPDAAGTGGTGTGSGAARPRR